jgi:hypothetical protein
MDADLLVEIPGHAACAVQRKEFVTLLEEKGWREIEPGVWTSPLGHEPDSTFLHLSRSLTPRRGCVPTGGGGGLRQDILVFKRRRDLGEAVWAIG